ncbi:MAG TPA: hypothetical protein PLD47_17795, partial [Aggregatilineales bacterium]|nr:hypothetical protein [Aggregatilineales bacterium]
RMKRLVILTAGACAVDEEDDLPAPGAAALWGMGRVIANEHSALRAQMIDLPSAALTDPLAMLHAAELAAQVINDPASEPEIALRGGIIFHHRL